MHTLMTVLLTTLLAIPGVAAADAVTEWDEIAGAPQAAALTVRIKESWASS